MKLKTKLGILLISISSVMLYVGCSSSDSSTSAPEDLVANTLADLPNCTENREGKTAVLLEDNSTYLCTEGKWTFVSAAIDVVESLDDLLNCTSKIEGDSVQVKEESAVYVCNDGEWKKWRVITDTLSTADDLLACVSKREGNTAFITKENALYECIDGSWEKIVTGTFTDTRDDQIYKYVKIGNQVWMAENLNYETANSYCYNDSTENCEKYGRLYTWEAALNACPEGWHLPTKTEFETLRSNVGGSDVAGKMLKSTTGWDANGNGVDKYGFNAIPAGARYDGGDFYYAGEFADFWSATDDDESDAYLLNLSYGSVGAPLNYYDKVSARSVRCLRASN